MAADDDAALSIPAAARLAGGTINVELVLLLLLLRAAGQVVSNSNFRTAVTFGAVVETDTAAPVGLVLTDPEAVAAFEL